MKQEMYKLTKQERENILAFSTHFNIHYNQYPKYQPVFDELSSLVGTKEKKELWCIITNLARALSQKITKLQIPKDQKLYSGNTQGISYRRMTALLDKMCSLGLFKAFTGGFISLDKQTYVPSVYVASEAFVRLYEGIPLDECVEWTEDTIEIKDRETKEKLNSKIAGTNVLRTAVKTYNKTLCNVLLTLDGQLLPVQQYKRVFSGNLALGGRWYNVCGGVQTMKQEVRKRLQINGESVVELDFKALHPSILYEWVWQDNPLCVEEWIEKAWDGVYNPYSTKEYELMLRVDEQEVEEHKRCHLLAKYEPLRALFKFTLMCCLNAPKGSVRPLQPAINALVVEWHDDKKRDVDSRRYVGLHCVGDTFPAQHICKLIQASNLPIAEHFFNDVGVHLQHVDSEIMSRVIQSLLDKGEVLYPEHDSVIVRESIEKDVALLMRQAYNDVVGSARFCAIEKK